MVSAVAAIRSPALPVERRDARAGLAYARPMSSRSTNLAVALALVLAGGGCKDEGTRRGAAAIDRPATPAAPTAPTPAAPTPPAGAPTTPPTTTPTPPAAAPTAAPTEPAGTATAPTAPAAPVAAMPASVPGCMPVAPHQRAGRATLTIVGDGLDVHDVVAPAICGALHLEATRRFAVGDGTQFKACLPDGNAFSITADVVLTGPQQVTFKYEDYKKKTALLELAVAGKGTYNQRDEPTDADKLTIAYDWHTAEAHVDVVWPSKKDRVVRVDAVFDCGAAMR